MKIRNGFVSNSSSSSFIVRANGDFPTVRSVAEYIMSCSDTDEESNVFKNLENLSDPNLPVYFNTWGDDTYLRKDGDFIIIQTSQNISLDRIYKNCIKKKDLPKGFGDKYNYIDEEYESYGGDLEDYKYEFSEPEDFCYYYQNFRDFVILEYGESVKGITCYLDNCPICGRFSRGFKLMNGSKICFCQIDKVIQKIERKEKIKVINENS